MAGKKIDKLMHFPVFHAGRRKIMHPDLKKEVYSQTAVCYMRFLRNVQISHIELPVTNEHRLSGRWVPSVPTHPAHIIVSILDAKKSAWEVIKDVELDPNPLFMGEGLSQEMQISRMEDFFKRAVEAQKPHRINLDGLETDCIKIECDREHPVWPNHGEMNGGPFNVPFGTLEHIAARGQELQELGLPVYRRKLNRAEFNPVAPEGMQINRVNPLEISFCGKKLSAGFSLIRPVLTHLDWDYFGEGNISDNRLYFRGAVDDNGPRFITPAGDFNAQNMTGTVAVQGNRIIYSGLETGCGIKIDAVFTVTAEKIELELRQKAEEEIPVIQGEAWRLAWRMRAGLTGVASPPVEKEGRNGFVKMPALISGDDGGCLLVELKEGGGMFHTESYRYIEARSTGFVMGIEDTCDKPLIIPKGESRAVFHLKPYLLTPRTDKKESELSEGVKRCWSAGFSAFRPEFGGFSNNAISTNCHVSQAAAFDFAAFTAGKDGIDPMEMVKFSVGRGLMDAGGYGYHRNLYLDTDPVLLSGAGRIFQLTGDKKWLDYVMPGIIGAARRIIENHDKKEGMIVCKALSGNSSTYRWSTNAMDVIGFGHIDAYVNAWSFRAMKNTASLCRISGETSLADNCADISKAISDNYAKKLINPETGWVSGWKSRDGQLHDFGFIWINGIACAFGVMDKATTHNALANLEKRRMEVFPESGYQGLPLNLIPIKETDHMLPQSPKYKLNPSYENYTDGALSPGKAGYYIRALSSNGLEEEAESIAAHLEQGFADGRFHGPFGTGKEFTTWTGADSGYEGTFGPNSLPLYAIAVQRGAIKPPDPEWWFEY